MVRRSIALARIGRHGPVLVERSTPDGKVENLHDDEGADDVSDEDFDANVLPAKLGQAKVEYEQT